MAGFENPRASVSRRSGSFLRSPMLAFLAVFPLRAQTPYLLKDINEEHQELGSVYMAGAGGRLFLLASDLKENKSTLWVSDGTPQGTRIVKDFPPPSGCDRSWGLIAAGDLVFFVLGNSQMLSPIPMELWVSDGTEEGTRLLRKIPRGSINDPVFEYPVAVRDRLFFWVRLPGRLAQLWSTDGTEAGTVLLQTDVQPETGYKLYFPDAVGYKFFAASGDKLFFARVNIPGNQQIWVTDGSRAATRLLWESSRVERELLGFFTPLRGELLFMARKPGQDFEIWRSDGTRLGTRFVAAVSAKRLWESWYKPFPVAGGRAFFSVQQGRVRGLWATDGTASGTSFLKELNSRRPLSPVVLEDRLVFSAYHGADFCLWTSDGTAHGTLPILELSREKAEYPTVTYLGVVDRRLLFTIWDPEHGRELWVTDGTPEGTKLLKDIHPGPEDTEFGQGGVVGRRCLFAVLNGEDGMELWASDGTPEGTGPIGSFPEAYVSWMKRRNAVVGRNFFFLLEGRAGRPELWVTNGTARSTRLVSRLWASGTSSDPQYLTALRGRLYFSAFVRAYGREPWVSDGTPEGTKPLADLAPGKASSYPCSFTLCGDLVFFFTGGRYGIQPRLWVTDGTSQGTRLLKSLDAGPEKRQLTENNAVLGDRFFFVTWEPRWGTEPWVSDGTPEGTRLLKDIAPGAADSIPSFHAVVGDVLFFSADDTDSARFLWKTDGTEAGTRRVANFPLSVRYYCKLSEPSTLLVLAASTWWCGNELWVTDGTERGTRLLKDIYPGEKSSFPEDLTPAGRRVFFLACDPVHGQELWVTDGTPGGTRIVNDILPGPEDGARKILTAAQDVVYFVGWLPETGLELWVSDGSAAGTRMVKDINPGPFSSSILDYNSSGRIRGMTWTGRNLLFAASGGADDSGLWVSDGTEAGTRFVMDVRFPGGVLTADGRVYFAGVGLGTGSEPWCTDGTPAGTDLLMDIYPGSRGSAPAEFTVLGDKLFFTAKDPEHGRELWALSLPDRGPSAAFVMSPEGCQPGRLIELDASPSVPGEGASIVRYTWKLGGGVTLTGPHIRYRYPEGTSGGQRVCLTVVDDKGRSDTTCRTFCISAHFRRGDLNMDGRVTLPDVLPLLSYFFAEGSLPCLDAADVNDTGKIELYDVYMLLYYLFSNRGYKIAPPFEACGPDPTPGKLGCESYPPCE